MPKPLAIKLTGGPSTQQTVVSINGLDVTNHVREIVIRGHVDNDLLVCQITLVNVEVDADLKAILDADEWNLQPE